MGLPDGGVNLPVGTACAVVRVVFGSFTALRVAQSAAWSARADAARIRVSITKVRIESIRIFVGFLESARGLKLGDELSCELRASVSRAAATGQLRIRSIFSEDGWPAVSRIQSCAYNFGNLAGDIL